MRCSWCCSQKVRQINLVLALVFYKEKIHIQSPLDIQFISSRICMIQMCASTVKITPCTLTWMQHRNKVTVHHVLLARNTPTAKSSTIKCSNDCNLPTLNHEFIHGLGAAWGRREAIPTVYQSQSLECTSTAINCTALLGWAWGSWRLRCGSNPKSQKKGSAWNEKERATARL